MPKRAINKSSSKLLLSSPFEKIAADLDSWIDIKEPKIIIKRYPFRFRAPLKMQTLSGREETKGGVLDLDFKLPNFPDGVDKPHVVILDTPESTAVSLGRLAFTPEDKLAFQLARFHVGYPAQKDMAYAARQSMQLPEVSSIITGLDNPKRESFIVYLAREGPMINLHGGIYNELKLNIPYTTAHARHEKESLSKFTRRAEVCAINFEGLVPTEAKVLIIVDNTASGMQHVKVLERAFEHINQGNHSGLKVERVLVVSPLLTKYGALAIAYFCGEYGIPTTFVASQFLLDCIGPLRYYSPVPDKDIYAADPKLLQINRFMLGNNVGKVCSACNWTARFSAEEAAYEASNEELEDVGINNDLLIQNGGKITPEFLKSIGLDIRKLIPYSTLADANDRGLLRQLQKII